MYTLIVDVGVAANSTCTKVATNSTHVPHEVLAGAVSEGYRKHWELSTIGMSLIQK